MVSPGLVLPGPPASGLGAKGPAHQLLRLGSALTLSGFSCTSRSGLGLVPVKAVFSWWRGRALAGRRGHVAAGRLARRARRLAAHAGEVAARRHGDGRAAGGPLARRRTPSAPLAGHEEGLRRAQRRRQGAAVGPLYMALTTDPAPVSCSLIGRPVRLTLVDRVSPMGILGAVSGLLWAVGPAAAGGGMKDMGRGRGLGGGGGSSRRRRRPDGDRLARWSSDWAAPWGGGGSSLLVLAPGLKSLDWSRMCSKSWCCSRRSIILLI